MYDTNYTKYESIRQVQFDYGSKCERLWEELLINIQLILWVVSIVLPLCIQLLFLGILQTQALLCYFRHPFSANCFRPLWYVKTTVLRTPTGYFNLAPLNVHTTRSTQLFERFQMVPHQSHANVQLQCTTAWPGYPDSTSESKRVCVIHYLSFP